ncbi:MAG: hypothetical protein CVV34_03770 [Methanomicrobiales archaeon HGW-Methanomicrobiales-5]|nr:MAG: hypothetical protein CVV34_03770 [Methanomicrobiales archaeon HGW-Methanomicrobiales-5]
MKHIIVDSQVHPACNGAIPFTLLFPIILIFVPGCLSSDIVGDRHDLSVTRTDAAGIEIDGCVRVRKRFHRPDV